MKSKDGSWGFHHELWGMAGRLFLGILAVGWMSVGCGRMETGTSQEEASGKLQAGIEESKEASWPEDGAKENRPLEEPDLHPYDFTLAFAGDVNLADDWSTMEHYRQQPDGIRDCIDPQLIQRMRDADFTCLNLECCLSSVGNPMEGKKYTFRGDPSHVEILEELGVDLANLANNHVYDYGEDAFLDMLDILQGAGIPYVGAGADAEEAQVPFYMELDGKRIAVVSATRAEKYILTPEALEDSSGVFRCYDMEKLLQTVGEAREQADFVIAYIHWGTEYSEELEEAQTEGARSLIDAGADVVLGAHPHCLQGAEFYEGKPILYSLGNYWFNEKTLDTVLVELRFHGNDEQQDLDTILVPARQEGHYTRLLTEEAEIEEWDSHMEAMPPGKIQIDGQRILFQAAE